MELSPSKLLSKLLGKATGLCPCEAPLDEFPKEWRGVFECRIDVSHSTPCFGERCGGPRPGPHTWHPNEGQPHAVLGYPTGTRIQKVYVVYKYAPRSRV